MPTKAVDLAAYLVPDRVLILAEPPAKAALLDLLADTILTAGRITDAVAFRRALHDREDVTSTGIGGGIAVPHARMTCIQDFVLALAIIPAGVDFAARDHLPVRVVVMIAAPEDERSRYLQVLAAVAARLGQPARREDLAVATGAKAALDRFLA